MTKHQRSTKRDPSYWEYVDALNFVQNSNSLVKRNTSSSDQAIPRRTMPILDFIRAFMIPLKTLSMSKLTVTVDIVQLLSY